MSIPVKKGYVTEKANASSGRKIRLATNTRHQAAFQAGCDVSAKSYIARQKATCADQSSATTPAGD